MKRTLITMAVTLMLTATLFAQRGPAGPSDRGPRNPGAVLDEAVRHYDDELQMMDEDGDIAVLIDEFAERLGECLKKGKADDTTRRAWLEALLNAASPNPTDVGNAAIALHAAQSKLPAERDYYLSELKKLLTGDQQQKLDTILAANGGRGLPIPGLGPGGPGFRGFRGQN